MKKIKTYLIAILIVNLSNIPCFAQEDTTNQATQLYPEVQSCIDSGVSSLKTSCVATYPDYSITNQDVFALTATEVAERATKDTNCSSKTSKIACNLCYQKAKQPLKIRFDGKIFHGLLKQATKIIEEQRKTTCATLKK